MAENRQVGVIYSPWVEEAEPLAKSLLDSLSKEHKPWVCSVLDLEENTEMAQRCSTFITIGGDGTILRTVRLAAPAGIPIVGVNLGRVGFMAELPADDAVARVNSFARGEGWLEERTMLEAQILPVRQSTKKLRSYSESINMPLRLTPLMRSLCPQPPEVRATLLVLAALSSTPNRRHCWYNQSCLNLLIVLR